MLWSTYSPVMTTSHRQYRRVGVVIVKETFRYCDMCCRVFASPLSPIQKPIPVMTVVRYSVRVLRRILSTDDIELAHGQDNDDDAKSRFAGGKKKATDCETPIPGIIIHRLLLASRHLRSSLPASVVSAAV